MVRLPVTPSTGRTVVIGLLGAAALLLAGTARASLARAARRAADLLQDYAPRRRGTGRPLTLHRLDGADHYAGECANSARRSERFTLSRSDR